MKFLAKLAVCYYNHCLLKLAISLQDIKSKYHSIPNPTLSFEDFSAAVDIINQHDPTAPNKNEETAKYAILLLRGKISLEEIIKKLQSRKETKSVSFLDQMANKYGQIAYEIEKQLQVHAKKYLDIALKWLQEGHPELEVISLINGFDAVSGKLPKNNLRNYEFEELHTDVSNVPSEVQIDTNVDLPLLANVGQYEIYEIQNASQGVKIGEGIPWDLVKSKLGGNGRWCITWVQGNLYRNYSAQNQYFYFVNDTSQDWEGKINELKCFVVHFMKDNNGNIVKRFITTLKNKNPPDEIGEYSQLSGISELIEEHVKPQPDRVAAKIQKGTASNKEAIEYLLDIVNDQHADINFMQSVVNDMHKKYFNKYMHAVFSRKSGEKEQMIMSKLYEICPQDIAYSDEDYAKMSKMFNLSIPVLKGTASKEEQIEVVKLESLKVKYIKNVSEEVFLIAQDTACKDPRYAYIFARNIHGADIRKCEEAACKDPGWAYMFARNIHGANIRKCEEAACKDPQYACYFARYVPGADIWKCEEAACKDPGWAYRFAHEVPGADIRKCEEAACKSPEYAYYFAYDVSGADIRKCQETACKNPYFAYKFALEIPGADISKCQEAACQDPKYAYEFTRDVLSKIPGADIRKCEEAACKDPEFAYHFALTISKADIRKCEEGACKDPEWAYMFALHVRGADIRKCEEGACKSPQWARSFARDVPGANKEKCRKAALW